MKNIAALFFKAIPAFCFIAAQAAALEKPEPKKDADKKINVIAAYFDSQNPTVTRNNIARADFEGLGIAPLEEPAPEPQVIIEVLLVDTDK